MFQSIICKMYQLLADFFQNFHLNSFCIDQTRHKSIFNANCVNHVDINHVLCRGHVDGRARGSCPSPPPPHFFAKQKKKKDKCLLCTLLMQVTCLQ